MKYLILSDIHANLEALDATLAAATRWDAILLLGDLVGYGADPNAVVERVRALPATTIIRGNHDKVGAGLESAGNFNHLARVAIEWTAATLTPDNRAWLAALPKGPMLVGDDVEICHGAPFDEDLYIVDELDARHAFGALKRPLCLFGHTHMPAAFRYTGDLEPMATPRGTDFRITLEPGRRYLVNCGAVGQPRDGDPRAAYGTLEQESSTVTISRIPYDVKGAQGKILAAGLPEVLARRLGVGR